MKLFHQKAVISLLFLQSIPCHIWDFDDLKYCSDAVAKHKIMHKEIISYDKDNLPSQIEKDKISNFLFTHLGKYGDAQADIDKAMDYALAMDGKPGGSITAITENDQVVCAVVINKTGMSGYIPENILVYIATHESQRGKGIGKKAMRHAIENSDGNIALHVEPDNPARYLYESLGFTNKYLEMRLNKNS